MAEEVDEEEAYPDPRDWRNWLPDGPFADGAGEDDWRAVEDEGLSADSAQGRERSNKPSPIPSRKREGRKSKRDGSEGEGSSPDGEGLRYRHDGFTPEKRRAFLSALEQTGCVDDACRMTGISDSTAYRTREKLPDFAQAWNAALARAAMPLRAIAWERATKGAEVKLIRDGKHVESRFKPSDAMLRLLLQGADPDAYGRPFGGAGGARGSLSLDQLDTASRKQLRQEAYLEHQRRCYGPEAKKALAVRLEQLIGEVKRRNERRALRDGDYEGGGGV